MHLHLEVADEPGVLARIAEILGRNGISVQSVVQRGLGDDARLVMVLHEAPESAFYAALDEIAALDFLRAAPRAIRVIEEVLCLRPLIERYRDYLPLEAGDPVVTLNQGSPRLSRRRCSRSGSGRGCC